MGEEQFIPLKDYFLLGDLHSAALLSNRGSVDWLCWPHFDSPSVFARILSTKGGRFSVQMDDWSSKASYRKNTAIVDTVFSKKRKSFKVTDFMVPQTDDEKEVMHLLVRKFSSATHHMSIRLLFDPQPDYGRDLGRMKRTKTKLMIPIEGQLMVLHMPKNTRIQVQEDKGILTFTLSPGEVKKFVLEYSKKDSHAYAGEEFEKWVERYWKKWVKNGNYSRYRRERVVRSAITLKLMQFYPTGALIAAPTTSLPETIGGVRNWDYRYTWVRDATFILYGLQLVGHTEEAMKFFRYIERVTRAHDAKDIHLKLFYTIGGDLPPNEKELKHLEGYMNSKPVRIGNGAKDQWQFDMYGTVIDSYYFMSRKGILPTPPSKALMQHLADRIEESWQETDSGIWEIRGKEHRYTYSRVMGWVGIDRLLYMRNELGLSDARVEHYTALRAKIHDWIWKHCFDEKKKIFKQFPRGQGQDATTFLFVLLGFLDKKDPLTKTIIENAAKELVEGDCMVYRYKNKDGIAGQEGAFILCIFWYISALAAVGEVKKAERVFKKLEKCMAENGLLAEELDPRKCQYLGNFPQAFSHIGYIMAVHYIEYAKKRQEQ